MSKPSPPSNQADNPLDQPPLIEIATDDAMDELLLEREMLTPELLRGAFEPTLVRASAGTGKTYQLTARLLKILLTGAPPESVLATTFTRKAAGEILTRVLTTLGDAADPENPEALASLQAQVGLPGLPRHVCGQLFHRLLKNIHRLRICTLDSLFSQLARALPFELDLPPGWRLTDEIEEVWLRQLAIGNMIDSLQTAEIESLISMLGRGDVKRNIARELIQVVETTYGLSRQASVEAWDQLDVPSRPESADMTRTAGSMRMAQPKQKSLRDLLEKMADHLDARDLAPLVEQTLLKNIYKARLTNEEIKFGRSKFPPELNADFEILYQAVKCESLSLLRSQNHATGSVADHYNQAITTVKQSQRSFAFDDIAVRLAAVFTTLSAETIQSKLDSKIDHLLLDEFQDTAPVQWQVLKVIADSVVTQKDADTTSNIIDPRRSQSFFCVGDTKQAIYGWRGGVAEIFDAVDEQIPGVRSVAQDQSYRSSQVVLDAVTNAFQNLTRHPLAETPSPEDPSDKAVYEAEALQEFAKAFPPQTAAKDLPGFVQFMTGPKVSPKPDPQNPDGKPIKPTAADIQAALVDQVASRIASLHQSDPGLSIGVLTRTNATVATLIDQLEARDVDVSAEGGNPLVDSVAVRWILSALMMVEHPGDGRWRHHIAFSPLAEHLPLSDDDKLAAANQLRRLIEDQGLPEAIQFLASALEPTCDDRERVRLQQLVELATLFHHTARSRLRDFVELVRIKRVQRPKAAAVRVMTVHQSKGLEFDAVFLPEIHKELIGQSPQCVADLPDLGKPPAGLSRSVGEKQWHYLPLRWQRTFGGNVTARMTEAMCLLYVAMTRARQGLYLFTPPSTKSDFANKNSASLLFHAWRTPDAEDSADPSEGNTVLFESGDKDWWQAANPEQPDHPGPDPHQPADTPMESAEPIQLAFQPIGDTPRRNAFLPAEC
ncbi:ATP-dependent exoDNAse (exonuclease V) beta subunit (contains helicase and exonuclease domains) [Neorhodopirellula lusitana]|uniref:DNA 3'-5' helicase n=1 Tax=Neorhodopirellula lusitana TaxID=445327 RepID=A0ABY1PXH7_9BACT|nr:UvrD-helicase domain-containing protein [Neorhodopirellula lusitana]SMP51839.1 ATP-dependent exoDNAse (exonuclease V) beta subunit (contains helicase and exonuclease domains) [Neorhodopirellula lusitana]